MFLLSFLSWIAAVSASCYLLLWCKTHNYCIKIIDKGTKLLMQVLIHNHNIASVQILVVFFQTLSCVDRIHILEKFDN